MAKPLLELATVFVALIIFVIGLFWIVFVVRKVFQWKFNPVKDPYEQEK